MGRFVSLEAKRRKCYSFHGSSSVQLFWCGNLNNTLFKSHYKEYSPMIFQCMDYIENHLHDRITVQMLADEHEMNASWLSTVFAKEVGMSVSDYIRHKKLTAAKYLLSYNEYSCTDIAEYLGFAGESHFSTL
ncbi:helix-turn-helix transcriptional regulator [Butyrivibrio sp. XPD2002]|uniref:helix-turn-helix transcriptional regulator n=1 Tax=Butyrivibrio sp. XPD2002 TaxID=1280665 RepID=UPI0018CAEFEE|nr:AraC family transcriptional regulator [Butyrivibrio sp. XPD2002]